MSRINVVLCEPEIPQNTGNIARTCAATGTSLHLIRPLGFEIDNAKLKRAGLDYWDKLDITYYEGYEDFLQKHPEAIGNTYFFTTKAPRAYTEVAEYPKNVFIMFGKESAGIPEEILVDYEDTCIRIPMLADIRSLNLSNSVAVVLYEALRQNGFEKMTMEGQLHTLEG